MSGGGKGGGTSNTATRPRREGWYDARLVGTPSPGSGFTGSAGVLPTFDQLFREQSANPINAQMQQGLAGIEALASQGSPVGAAAQNVLLNILNNPTAGQGVADTAMAGGYVNPAMAETQRVAMGGDIGANPWLQSAYDNAARSVTRSFRENTVPALDRAAQASGRTGSGQYALMRNRTEEGLANQLGDMATNIFGSAYETDQGRRMGALGQLAGLGQQDVQNRFAGAQLGDAATRQQLAAIGLGGQAFDLQAQPYNALLGTGQFRQQQPWQPALTYQDALNRSSTVGQTTTASGPGANPMAGLLQGGLGGAATGAMIGSVVPGLGTGLGALIGGGAGGLAGLLSDVRAKKDIRRVGKTDGGTPIYSYRYKGDDGPVMMGVLAQDVAQRQPEAVRRRPDGLLSVLYERVA